MGLLKKKTIFSARWIKHTRQRGKKKKERKKDKEGKKRIMKTRKQTQRREVWVFKDGCMFHLECDELLWKGNYARW